MTISLERGGGSGASAGALALLRWLIAGRLAGATRRRAPRAPCAAAPTPSEVSFEIHVEQALSIARAAPTLRAVSPPPMRRTARS